MIQKTFYTISLEIIITLLKGVSSTSYFNLFGGNRKPIHQQSNEMMCTVLDQSGLKKLSPLCLTTSSQCPVHWTLWQQWFVITHVGKCML